LAGGAAVPAAAVLDGAAQLIAADFDYTGVFFCCLHGALLEFMIVK
jgi:hypothetical protein